jgi:septal ring factor EnvC (AmiA/AmiB activator)
VQLALADDAAAGYPGWYRLQVLDVNDVILQEFDLHPQDIAATAKHCVDVATPLSRAFTAVSLNKNTEPVASSPGQLATLRAVVARQDERISQQDDRIGQLDELIARQDDRVAALQQQLALLMAKV